MGQALFSSGQSMLVHAVGNMNKTKCLLALLSQCLHLTASKEKLPEQLQGLSIFL